MFTVTPLQGPLRGPAQRIPPRKQEPERAAHHTAGCSPPPKKREKIIKHFSHTKFNPGCGGSAGRCEGGGARGAGLEGGAQLTACFSQDQADQPRGRGLQVSWPGLEIRSCQCLMLLPSCVLCKTGCLLEYIAEFKRIFPFDMHHLFYNTSFAQRIEL